MMNILYRIDYRDECGSLSETYFSVLDIAQEFFYSHYIDNEEETKFTIETEVPPNKVMDLR